MSSTNLLYLLKDDGDVDTESQHSEEEDSGLAPTQNSQKNRHREKANKTSGRSVFQAKVEALFMKARRDAANISRDLQNYAAQAEAQIGELRSRREPYHKAVDDIISRFNDSDEMVSRLLEEYFYRSEDLGSQIAGNTHDSISAVRQQRADKRHLRRELIWLTKAELDAGEERLRIATDASNLIQHFKALLVDSGSIKK